MCAAFWRIKAIDLGRFGTRTNLRVRPLSPEPDDDFFIECAFNARASIVTQNLKDFRVAQEILRIPVLAPADFLAELEE